MFAEPRLRNVFMCVPLIASDIDFIFVALLRSAFVIVSRVFLYVFVTSIISPFL